MKNLKLVMICVPFLLSSCSMLKKQTSKTATEQVKELSLSRLQTVSLNHENRLVDSSQFNQEIIFWPKGIVKYSPSDGFEGEAFKISLRSKAQMSKKLVGIHQAHIQVSTKLSNTTKASTEGKTFYRLKKGKMISILGLILLGLGAGLVYLCYRYKWFWFS